MEEKKKKKRNKGMDLWIFAWVLVVYGLLRVCMDFWLVPNLGFCWEIILTLDC